MKDKDLEKRKLRRKKLKRKRRIYNCLLLTLLTLALVVGYISISTESKSSKKKETQTVEAGLIVEESNKETENANKEPEKTDETLSTIANEKVPSNHRGWVVVNDQYQFYDRISGDRILGQTIDGIEISADGTVQSNPTAEARIGIMIKAHNILDEITESTDSMDEKKRKAFDWVLSKQYRRFRLFSECYEEPNIEITFAEDIFDRDMGDCVSESVAVALLFHEIGYTNVTFCSDSGHAWVDLDGKLYDPLFAEANGFEDNYDSDYTDYRSNPMITIKIYE